MDHALYHHKVDGTFTVQDCVLEFIYRTYNTVLFDETPASAATLNRRLHWKEQTERRFANTTFEVTFDFQGEHFRATKSENHYCAIWKERKR